MSALTPPPIACDLGALTSEERECGQRLLAEFKARFREPQETENGYIFVIPNESGTLARLGAFLALERICCPFLTFDLAVPARRGPVTLHVHGEPAAKSFVRSVFFG